MTNDEELRQEIEALRERSSRLTSDLLDAGGINAGTLIKMLRRKLGDDARAPTYIFNVRGVGYLMARRGET